MEDMDRIPSLDFRYLGSKPTDKSCLYAPVYHFAFNISNFFLKEGGEACNAKKCRKNLWKKDQALHFWELI